MALDLTIRHLKYFLTHLAECYAQSLDKALSLALNKYF